MDDDLNFARLVLEIARGQGFKGLIALRSSTALAMLQKYQPCAVTLDICLPGDSGWTILDRIKHDPKTVHIPGIIMSVNNDRQRGQKLGAYSYYQKPLTRENLVKIMAGLKQFIERPVKNLLLVTVDQEAAINELLGNSDIQIITVAEIPQIRGYLENNEPVIDCLIVDSSLPEMTHWTLIETLKEDLIKKQLPLIIYGQPNLSEAQKLDLEGISHSIPVKIADNELKLVQETALLLHRKQSDLPEKGQNMLKQLRHNLDNILANKKVLIVDDDVRNIFALTSLLERYQMQVIPAENGAAGIACLQNSTDIDLVLMDVMMPGMDGYETMKAIRKLQQFQSLPIIALTAKAMKGDRDKCLDAGASDYITKPVDTEQLLSILRVWLS